MLDPFMRRLFADVFNSMGITLEDNNQSDEYELIVDDNQPVLLRYDSITERVVLVSLVDTDAITSIDDATLYKHLLHEALNPLRNDRPGIGVDKQSGVCLSYLAISRQNLNSTLVCEKLVELIEWNKGLVQQLA